MISLTPEERFWAKVEQRGPDECWRWTGTRDNRGRPAFRLSATIRTTAARALWLMRHGDIPLGQVVRHACDNIECVNPAHLYLAERTGPSVPSGLGEAATNAKLTEAEAREILAARGRVTAKELAERYGVSVWTVKTIWKGQSWGHIREE